MQTLKDRHVVVTGGTGALGAAVVLKFIEAGAICHIPAIESTPPSGRLPDSKQVSISPSIDLSDEASVDGFYGKLPPLHAVVNIAGGFAYAPIADSPAKVLQQQISMNLVSCVLSCRAAVANFRKGQPGWPHRQHLGPACPQSAPGRQHDGLYGLEGRGRGLHRRAGRGVEERKHLGHRACSVDHRHAGQPQGHADGQARHLGQAVGARRADRGALQPVGGHQFRRA